MKYCTRCGTQLDDADRFCKSCGHMQTVDFTQPVMPETPSAQTQYQQPYLQQNRPLPFNASPANAHPVYAPVYAPAVPRPYAPPVQPKPAKRPNAVAYLIWSVCLILVLNPIGSLLGIAASVFACKANAAPSAEDFIDKRRTARKLCVAGTCVDAATLVFVISYIVAFSMRFGLGDLLRIY